MAGAMGLSHTRNTYPNEQQSRLKVKEFYALLEQAGV
jgi:hypothetical protein